MPRKPEQYYSAGEVARMLGIARQVVHYHTRRLGVGHKVGPNYVYSPKDVEAIRLHTRRKDQ